MTIDLGFAWMTLPDGVSVGIVDVPGHRDFIDNMLAGVRGIDAALLVIAADEGVMPQTREHLAILDMLAVERAVVALTKVDLVDEEDWLELVKEEIDRLLQGTSLAGAPIVGVSALSGEGLAELQQELAAVLAEVPARLDRRRPRLSVDRAFSMTGFGTVVTGTLVDGSLHAGDEVEIQPGNRRARIRGIQTHRSRLETAIPGSRVALNLAGVDVDDIQRGMSVQYPGTYLPTRTLDVHFSLLPDSDNPLKHDQVVKVFLGAAQSMGRVRLLQRGRLEPGQSGWLQLILQDPLIAARGDRFILRRPSPSATLGGGVVADDRPPRKHRRLDPQALSRLEGLLLGEPQDILAQALVDLGLVPLRQAVERSGLEAEIATQAIESLAEGARLIALEAGELTHQSGLLVMDTGTWEQLRQQIAEALEQYHQQFPLRSGMPREELKSRLAMQAKTYAALIEYALNTRAVVLSGQRLSLPGFQVVLNQQQQSALDQLLRLFSREPFSPPSVKDCLALVGDELYAHLKESGRLVQLSADVVFERATYDRLLRDLQHKLQGEATITVAEIRDQYNTSRKYALAFLEHCDQIGITSRQGDLRRLRTAP